jgi:hypothetical protein
MLQIWIKGNPRVNLKTGEFPEKRSSMIYFASKYSTPLFLLENLNYNVDDDDGKRVIKIKPTLFDYKKASCVPL